MSRPSWAEIAGELDGSTEIDALTAELAAARDELTRALSRIDELEAGIEAHRERITHNFDTKGIAPGHDDETLWALLSTPTPKEPT